MVLPGLWPRTGVSSRTLVNGALGPLQALSGSRRLLVLNRWPGLPAGMTMAGLTDEYADALAGLGSRVDVVGTSTGGSIAQQLAADHPGLVRRLVLVSTACRLGHEGRRLQAQLGRLLREGHRRRAAAALTGGMVPPRRGRPVASAGGWLLARQVLGAQQERDDLATTIEAEDAFDLARRPTIHAPTLIVAGALDRYYPQALFHETAALIPGAELRIIDGRGHVTVTTDRGVTAEMARFLND